VVSEPLGACRSAWSRLALIVLMAACLAGPVQARDLDQLEHRRWNAADGGPSQVGALAQTRDGYLWLGTNDSLFRFDGLRFVRYAPPAGGALGIVSSLLPVDDSLWVGLRAGGVNVMSAGAMQVHAPGAGLPAGAVYSLARDREQGIWAAADDGLARFDGTRWQRMSSETGFPGEHARAVFVDRAGVVWAANEDRLFYRASGASAFVDAGLAVAWASQITQGPDGAIWVSERYAGSLHRVELEAGRVAVRSIDIGTSSNGLLFDRSGAMWISTLGSGLLYLAEPGSSLSERRPITAREGLSGDHVWPLLEDRDGNVWVGSNAGIDRFRPRVLIPAHLPAGTLNAALVAGSDNSLWAGTSNRPAMRLVGDRVETLDMPAPVTSAMRDSTGTVWMGGPQGIWQSQDTRLVRVADLPAGAPPDSSVRAMLRGGAGDLWVSINRLGLFVLREGAWRALPPPSTRPSQVMPVSASTDPQGRLWFGYRDNLLVTRDATGERRWGEAEGLQIGHVTAIAHEGKRTWLGGQRGVAYVEGDRVHMLRLPEQGLFDNIYAIVPVPGNDAVPDLWIHAKAGIFQLPSSEVAQVLADDTHRIRYRAQDLTAGLANDPYQVLPLPTAVRGEDGRLWFSTSNGVVWLDPARPAPNQAGPQASIESVSADGARVDDAAAPVVLAADTKRVVFDYTALSLSAPESLRFRYRLDGYDQAWQDAGRQRQAVYTGLGAGAYRFRVLAYDADGAPSPQEALSAFQIPRVFYLRPWFLAPASALVLGLLWLLYRMHLGRQAEALRARLEERHGERERIARELHDTLLQGVQGLMLHFQAVMNMLPGDGQARRSMERALDRADLVIAEGRDRVRELRTTTRERGELDAALRTLGEDCARGDDAGFTLVVHGEPTSLHPVVGDEVYRIGHEAVVNAFAHAQASQVRVEIDYGDNAFGLRVHDDGRGIDAQYLTPQGRPEHWGLRGMHERAQKAGGVLRIVSAPGGGTDIRLSIKAALAYEPQP
jgi:signal transduction histidine kinase/ligand-binding sensor domain-containing protein